ncbi:hypothetical protein TGDOM2_400950, partial [Toxoplasma gondii GAB2-2007-GAL-DOM2]
TWSERAMRSAHYILQLLDRRCTPGVCPAYPSSTLRLVPARGREPEDPEDDGLECRVLALPSTRERRRDFRPRDLQPRDFHELHGRPASRQHRDALGISTSRHFTGEVVVAFLSQTDTPVFRLFQVESRKMCTGCAYARSAARPGFDASATGIDGERGNDWAVVRLGAEGSYEVSKRGFLKFVDISGRSGTRRKGTRPHAKQKMAGKNRYNDVI